jgi:hypothetical protein
MGNSFAVSAEREKSPSALTFLCPYEQARWAA